MRANVWVASHPATAALNTSWRKWPFSRVVIVNTRRCCNWAALIIVPTSARFNLTGWASDNHARTRNPNELLWLSTARWGEWRNPDPFGTPTLNDCRNEAVYRANIRGYVRRSKWVSRWISRIPELLQASAVSTRKLHGHRTKVRNFRHVLRFWKYPESQHSNWLSSRRRVPWPMLSWFTKRISFGLIHLYVTNLCSIKSQPNST